MPKRSDSLPRYNFSVSDSIIVTDSGAKYSFDLIDSASYFPQYPGNIVSLTFDLLNGEKAPFNAKFKNTIVFLIESYFEKNYSNVLIYVCDSTDNRHFARNRLFQKWFDEFNTENQYEKYDIEIDTDGIILSSLIVRRDNFFKELIIDSYNKQILLEK